MSSRYPVLVHLPHDRLRVTLTAEERDLLRAAVAGNARVNRSRYLVPGTPSLLNQHYAMEVERSEVMERLLCDGAEEMSADQARWLLRIGGGEAARRIFSGEAL